MLLWAFNHRSLARPLISHYWHLGATDRHMLGTGNDMSPQNLITTKSYRWGNDAEYSLLHRLHYTSRCVTEEKNCLKTNGLSVLRLLMSHIIKVHSTLTSCEWVTDIQLRTGITVCSIHNVLAFAYFVTLQHHWGSMCLNIIVKQKEKKTSFLSFL